MWPFFQLVGLVDTELQSSPIRKQPGRRQSMNSLVRSISDISKSAENIHRRFASGIFGCRIDSKEPENGHNDVAIWHSALPQYEDGGVGCTTVQATKQGPQPRVR